MARDIQNITRRAVINYASNRANRLGRLTGIENEPIVKSLKTIQIEISVQGNPSDVMLIPWSPDSISINGNEIRVAEYEIINIGQVRIPVGSNLRSVSWSGSLPGSIHEDLPFLNKDENGAVDEPQSYIDKFDTWRTEGTVLHLLIYDEKGAITATYFDEDVILSDYSSNLSGGVGDISYDVSFTEYRDIDITKGKIPKYHKLKKGDTLAKISIKYWGAASKKKALYKWNKKEIEKAAKAHKKKSSKKGKLLYSDKIKVDGVVGRIRLFNPGSKNAKKKFSGALPNVILKKGDTGDQVKRLQKFLNWYGNYKLKVNGKFTGKVEKKLKKFQKANGLKPTGKTDKKTRTKMKNVKK